MTNLPAKDTREDIDVPAALFEEAESLLDILDARANSSPHKTCYTFLKDGESIENSITFSELQTRAQALAAYLLTQGAQHKPVLLVYPSGIDYVVAFVACLYAQAIAIPLYPPRDNLSLSRILSVVDDSDPVAFLSNSSVYERLLNSSRLQQEVANQVRMEHANWILTDCIDLSGLCYRSSAIKRSSLAYLQYTSGSTSAPKGVMVSHGNVLHNQSVIKHYGDHNTQLVTVTWLPMFHDMGLVGTIMPTIYSGGSCYIMSPTDFIRKPVRWLQAISDYQATFSAAPNFAYDLCVKRVSEQQRDNLNLTQMQAFVSGAEPIKKNTLENFSEKFSRAGLNREALFVSYGMAETTLIVTGEFVKDELASYVDVPDNNIDLMRRNSDNGFVSCGKPCLKDDIKIVNPDDQSLCEDGTVGEVWVNSLSVTMGYWNNQKASKEVYNALINGANGKAYFRTGDLGYIRNGALYVTGRLKDVIIIRGENYYPQDIELTLENNLDVIQRSTTIAFHLSLDEDKLVVVSEVERSARNQMDFDLVVAKAKKVVLQEFGLSLHALVLIRPNTTLKTTSGKLQRSATKQAYLNNRLHSLFEWKSIVHSPKPAETTHVLQHEVRT